MYLALDIVCMKRILGMVFVVMVLFAGCISENGGAVNPPVGGVSAPSCTDSDGGKDATVKGSVESTSGRGTDTCLGNGEMVMEYYCSGGLMNTADINCTGGKVCSDGACRDVPCFDTDGGKDSSVKGTVQYQDIQYTDYCTPEGNVKEYYCSPAGGYTTEIIGCNLSEECIDGACVAKPACTDTDGGENLLVQGTTTYGSVSQQDSCANGYAVIEYYCGEGVLKSAQMECATDEECLGGKCVSSPSAPSEECTDSDGGQNIHQKGTVTYWSEGERHTATDSCSGTYAVWENWCNSEGGIGFGPIDCDGGEICSNGRCVED